MWHRPTCIENLALSLPPSLSALTRICPPPLVSPESGHRLLDPVGSVLPPASSQCPLLDLHWRLPGWPQLASAAISIAQVAGERWLGPPCSGATSRWFKPYRSSTPAPKKIVPRPMSSSLAAAPAPKKIAPRPMPSSLAAAPPSVARPRATPPASSSKIIARKPAARPAAAGSSLAAPSRAAESVHPARRLACGTAVYVRTRYVMITDRCCLLIWLPARVVSASDAYHFTVKYAADLHAMFAGKVVSVPAADVREAPHRPASKADLSKKPQAP